MEHFLDWLDKRTGYKHNYGTRYHNFRWRHERLYENIDFVITTIYVVGLVVIAFVAFTTAIIVLVNVFNTPNCDTAANYFGMGYTNNLLTGCNIEVEPGKFMPLNMIKYAVTP